MTDQAVRHSRRTSWHLIDWDKAEEGPILHSLCGRKFDESRDEFAGRLPGDQKTCERCAVVNEQRETPV